MITFLALSNINSSSKISASISYFILNPHILYHSKQQVGIAKEGRRELPVPLLSSISFQPNLTYVEETTPRNGTLTRYSRQATPAKLNLVHGRRLAQPQTWSRKPPDAQCIAGEWIKKTARRKLESKKGAGRLGEISWDRTDLHLYKSHLSHTTRMNRDAQQLS